MSVVGIDLGALNTVVAVARNRGIDVIVNETSNRATPSLVSFGEKQRFLGESAKSLEISNFKNTVSQLKRFIGRPLSDPELASLEKRFLNARIDASSESDEASANVMYKNEMTSFSFTELVSMFLVKVKDFTAAEIKIPVTDCVISCPTWFTDRQRRALLDASEIAGLNCLRLMNDTTASALAYGITKTDLPDPTADSTQKPRVVCFVDMGYSSYQVSVVSFVKGKLSVLGTAYDRNLGGRDFDQVLVEHYTTEFSKKYKIDIASNAKATFRLRQACEKVKKVLSANAVTMLNVECIMDDKDVSSQVQRADFEELALPLVARLAGPLEAALKAANVTPENVDFVELVGGSTRVPSVKDALAKFFGAEKLSTTLNLDEAVARGCALQCAIISPVFKVRDFAMQDWNSYPVELKWDANQVPVPSNGDPVVTQLQAFPTGNAVPSSKMLTFVRSLKDEELAADGTVSMDVIAEYQPESVTLRNFPSGLGSRIGHWTISGIKKLAPTDTKALLKVRARLDGNGVVSLDQAHQIEETQVPVKDNKDEKKETESSDAKDKEDTPMEDATSPSNESPKDKDVKMQTVVKKHKLIITSKTGSLSRDLLAKFLAAEGEMAATDRLVIDTAEKRNALEEYVYETRSKLEMAWSEYITDSEKTTFLQSLNDTENWLYTEEGEDATKSVYVEKLKGLKAVGDPVAFRYAQHEERPIAEKELREYLNSVSIDLSAEDDRYAHIAKEDLEKVENEVKKKMDWLNDAIAKQNETPKHLPPVVTSDQIQKEKELVQFYVNPILNKPKPAPKKEEPKKETKDEAPKEGAEPAPEAAKPAQEMEVD